MDEFIQAMQNVTNAKSLFFLSGICIFTDIITGYLKAFKFHKTNSSISRDGYIKKIAWIVALILGFLIDFVIGTSIFLVGTALMCFATEIISVYENLGELGVKVRYKQYFEKLKAIEESKEDNE